MDSKPPAQKRPIWQIALTALLILFVASELAFLLVATAARRVIDGGATAHDGFVGALSNGFFAYGENSSGAPVFMAKGFFLLPGFNSLYYLVFGLVEPAQTIPFITSGLAALLIAMFAIVAFLATSAGKGLAVTTVLALVFAAGWVVLYAATEASMFANSFFPNMSEHWPEIPVAFICLLVISSAARRLR